MSGTLRSSTVSLVSKAAAIIFIAAFLAPPTLISPFREWPPWIMNLDIFFCLNTKVVYQIVKCKPSQIDKFSQKVYNNSQYDLPATIILFHSNNYFIFYCGPFSNFVRRW